MTAEIAILNRQAIALAADSAVTMQMQRGPKIFTSANKLFALSRCHPVAVMIYGNAALIDTPWETIIKVYRTALGDKEYARLEEYASDFISFLGTDARLFPEEPQRRYVRDYVEQYMEAIRTEARDRAEQVIMGSGKVTVEDMSKIISDTIQRHYDLWDRCPIPTTSSPQRLETIREKFDAVFRDIIASVFEQVDLSQEDLDRLLRVAATLFVKFPPEVENSLYSGVVFAGFGRDDMYPVVQSFAVEGLVDSLPKYTDLPDKTVRIGESSDGAVIPFAQEDVVYTFMEGVEPRYEQTVERFILDILQQFPVVVIDSIDALTDEQKEAAKTEWRQLRSKEIFAKYRGNLQNYRFEKHILNVMSIVRALPKDELAAMAEALVNLTSFKRRISAEMETVGGPIDVAVISKGDGLIWIKRKHYFRPELNPQFFGNRHMEAKK